MCIRRYVLACLLALSVFRVAPQRRAHAADPIILQCDSTITNVLLQPDGQLLTGGPNLSRSNGSAMKICSFASQASVCGGFMALLQSAYLSGREVRMRFMPNLAVGTTCTTIASDQAFFYLGLK